MSLVEWGRSGHQRLVTSMPGNAPIGSRQFSISNDNKFRTLNLQCFYTNNGGGAATALRISPYGRFDVAPGFSPCMSGTLDTVNGVFAVDFYPISFDLSIADSCIVSLTVLPIQYLMLEFDLVGGNADDVLDVFGVFTT